MATRTSAINGTAIRVIRQRSDMTGPDLISALAANGVKLHVDSLYNIELGHQPCSIPLANAIAKAMKCPKVALYNEIDDAA